jgi:hypothetical protein
VWAIRSVQHQTVRDMEICIICDGSPEHMVRLFQEIAAEDERIRVYVYPKSPRTGEPYRDIIIGQTSGSIICYCSHDDLWLPTHVQEMERVLKKWPFAHSLHAVIAVPEKITRERDSVAWVPWISLQNKKIRETMQRGENFFGLTFAAHRRDSYYQLPEGWVTTPDSNVPTDLYMWQKFLACYGNRCRTITKVTALSFQQIPRKAWTAEQRDHELLQYVKRLRDPGFARTINSFAVRFCPSRVKRFLLRFSYSCLFPR